MREILSAEQPCVLCGSLLQIVTMSLDEDTGEKRIERENLPHPDRECADRLATFAEQFPMMRDGAAW